MNRRHMLTLGMAAAIAPALLCAMDEADAAKAFFGTVDPDTNVLIYSDAQLAALQARLSVVFDVELRKLLARTVDGRLVENGAS